MADIGWLTLAEAETYFTTRLESGAWTGTDAVKTAALTTAYNRIRYLKDYTIPTSPTAAQELILMDAQCELSLYMLIHLEDEDRRKGLMAQGVAGAGIVKETFVRFGSDVIKADEVPLPPIVKQMLNSFYDYNQQLYAVDIDRDEDYTSSEDLTTDLD